MTTRDEISGWFDRGVRIGATHMLVVWDSFSNEDYPVFVRVDINATEGDSLHSVDGEALYLVPHARVAAAKYDGQNMQQLMECYKLDMDKATQMAEVRAYHYD